MRTATLYTHEDGIKAYSNLGLRLYDALIVRALAPHVWGCPPQVFLDHYHRHLSSNHADVGVGTGYFLDRCDFGTPEPRIALIDLQPNCLKHAARRLARYRPEIYVRDAHQPLQGVRPFDSIALGGILHCLPGDMRRKSTVFDALRHVARPGATIFGYTLVNDAIGERRSRRLAFHCLHRLRVVNFANDSASDLTQALATRFVTYTVQLIGCFALFAAAVPHVASTHHTSSGGSNHDQIAWPR